jgi:hypothetical protein
MWRSLGMLLGRLRPAWWQGRDRWLGRLAMQSLLGSTAALTPYLAFDGWDELLVPQGEANGTCAYVDPLQMARLGGLLEGSSWAALARHAEATFGSAVDDWKVILRAALRYAEERALLLLEGDEIFAQAYRWPAL